LCADFAHKLALLESVLSGPVSIATALDGPTRRRVQSRPVLLRPVDGVVVSDVAAASVPDVDVRWPRIY